MATIPPYLKQGDTIGLVCPSGYMPIEKAETAIRVLKEWGFNVKVGLTVGMKYNYFAGTDIARLADLQEMMNDRDVSAILCARGGYGLSRIIDKLSFKKFNKRPKWIIGYSDITVLHSHLYTQYNIASLHSPMAAAFNNDGYKNEYVRSMRSAIMGDKANYSCVPHPFNRKGEVSGRLLGGNLSILVHLLGSPSSFDYKNRILFIEDVGEYIYNIDRMLYQLKRAGVFNDIKGLIVGGFTEMKDTQIPFGQTVDEVIRDIVSEYDFPVCYNFPVSHTDKNYALKVGVKYKLDINDKGSSLAEE
jgi:muramoyltetrapeptide carboxypeptidase